MVIRVQAPVSRVNLPKSAPVAPRAPTSQRGPVDSFESQPHRIPAGPPTLQRGTVGGQVAALQQRLHARGFLSSADISTGRGVFGPRTEAAVKRFQESCGLPPTGVVGPSTYKALAGRAPAQEPSTDLFTTVTGPDPRMEQTLTDDFTEPVGRPLADKS